jgi:arylsulfatase A-like enzyme
MRSAGVARRQPVNLLDLYPTLVELCRLPANPRLDGTSLVPLLKDAKAKRNPTVSTFMPGNHAVISERWRYIVYSDGSEELYDRQADPNEYTNLGTDYAEVRRKLAQFAPKTSAPMTPDRTQYDFDFTTYSYRRKATE